MSVLLTVTPEPEVELEIGADELIASFISDEDAALAEYRGKTIQVSGEFRQATSFGDFGHFLVATGDFDTGVICGVSAERFEATRKRQAGEPMTVKGTVNGYRKHVTLDGCKVIA